MRHDYNSSLTSVITPVFNRRQLIIETLESVAAQTHRPIELIVVDDGSTDGTGDAVATWFQALDDTRREGLSLKLLRCSNGGQQRARNSGLAVARGEFIQLLDSDDILHPHKIEKQCRYLETHPEVAFVYSSMVTFSGAFHAEVFENTFDRQNRFTHLAALNWIQGLFRHDTCAQLGPFNEKIACRQDMEYMTRLIVSGRRADFLPGFYSAGRRHDEVRVSTSSSCRQALDALICITEIFEKQTTLDQATQQLLADQFFRTGLSAMMVENRFVAREASFHGLRFKSNWERRIKLRMLQVVSGNVLNNFMRRISFQRIVTFYFSVVKTLRSR